VVVLYRDRNAVDGLASITCEFRGLYSYSKQDSNRSSIISSQIFPTDRLSVGGYLKTSKPQICPLSLYLDSHVASQDGSVEQRHIYPANWTWNVALQTT
jgi:hypothetical protein